MGQVFKPIKYTLFMGQPRPILDIVTDYVQVGPAPSPSPTPTITITPSITPTLTSTPTNTPSVTPTITSSVTPTVTPTPSSTPPPSGDPDAQAYLDAVVAAGGSIDTTISDATNNLFESLKAFSLYDKLLTFYPMLGGVGASHSLNAKRSMGTTYDMDFFGGWVHDSTGALGNTSNTYADTKYNPFNETTFDQLTFGLYNTNSTTVNGEFYNGSINNVSPQQWASLRAQNTSTRVNIGVNDGSSVSVVAGQTGLYIATTNSTNRSSVCYNGVFSNGVTLSSAPLPPFNQYMGALNLTGVRYGSINFKYTFWFNSNVRLTSTECVDLSNIINTFQTTLGRNTY